MKQKNKIHLLLVAAFAGLSVMCYAQGKVCAGTAYDIVSLQDPSDPSAYEWLENGAKIPGAAAAAYTVPAGKAVGQYTYIRRSKKDGCDWASSNAYTVEVLTCGDAGASIGAKGTIQDPRDQKVYKTVRMPDSKVWMAENLNYQKDLTFNQQANQANGVPFVSMDNGIAAIGSFWCPGTHGATSSADKNTCNVYGAFYTWETAMSTDGQGVWDESKVSSLYHDDTTTPADASGDPNIKGICPGGWHLPSEYEWAVLLDAVDVAADPDFINQSSRDNYGSDGAAGVNPVGAGVQLKSASTYIGTDPGNGAWHDHTNRGNDATGFSAVATGYRSVNYLQFVFRGYGTNYWSSSVNSSAYAWYRQLSNETTQVFRNFVERSYGFSVRCVQD
jgi:uncharacterized protein (TIGR02145 family)